MANNEATPSFTHSGKLGDIVYSLRTVRMFKHGRFFLNGQSIDLPRRLIQSLLPLLRSQPYVEQADVWRGEAIDFDLDRFRLQVPWDENLADRHAKAVGLPIGDQNEPWLSVEEPLAVSGRPVAFARSANYRGIDGFWERCYEALGSRAFFLGTAGEHSEFCASVGAIPHVPAKDLLEVARLIAGASLFVGNQSCPYAIAEGLKRPVIQETHLQVPNCVFPRAGAVFVMRMEDLETALGGIGR